MTTHVRIEFAMVLGLSVMMLSGCALTSGARYVYQDGEFGVVAIPRNTPNGSRRYRKQAEALMARHFPAGYEIVRAEEVALGSRTLTVGRSGSAELAPESSARLFTGFKLARSRTRSEADTLTVTECRIIYKKAGHRLSPGALAAFAPEASLTPTCYIDPNKEARTQPKEKEKDTVKVAAEKKDPDMALAAKSPVGE
jgi:hypothetical protein